MQEGDVDFVGQQTCCEVARLALHQFDFHSGAREPETLNKLRHVSVGRKHSEAEPQATGFPPCGRAGPCDRLRSASDSNAGLIKKCVAGLRQLDATTIAFQKRDADFLFEGADAQTQRRLGHVRVCGGATEMQIFGYRDEATHCPPAAPCTSEGSRSAHAWCLWQTSTARRSSRLKDWVQRGCIPCRSRGSTSTSRNADIASRVRSCRRPPCLPPFQSRLTTTSTMPCPATCAAAAPILGSAPQSSRLLSASNH